MDGVQDFGNPQVRQLPAHLRKYIVDQNYQRYTFADHALWRYVMRQNYSYLKGAAYYPYIPGLRSAGLTIEKIPSLQEINDSLARIGWGAVTVDGFIPPAAFMEYQAMRVLVIAADIRRLEHIEYTPAPDIIHEAAGHAPIISDPDYNRFLSHLGTVGTKAMFSRQDHELYEAIRELSMIKEIPGTSPEDLRRAEEKLMHCRENMGEPSEMALLSRLQWWTVEYGLIGPLDNPKIYGAGLLSSIGESVSCMRPEVKKLPYTIEALNYPYDITKPQPQLFVTPEFGNLLDVLHQFEQTMAASIGGLEGLSRAVASGQVCTAVLDSGLGITGKFGTVHRTRDGQPAWFSTEGPSAFSWNDKVLPGGRPEDHPDGVKTVIGLLSGSSRKVSDMSRSDLNETGIREGDTAIIHVSSGITLSGVVTGLNFIGGKLAWIQFASATALTTDGEILHQAPDGPLCLAFGAAVRSVFSGSADKSLFEDGLFLSGNMTQQARYSASDLAYHRIFGEIRDLRERGGDLSRLETLWMMLQRDHPDDWLATLEMAELTRAVPAMRPLYRKLRNHLDHKRNERSDQRKLITDGLAIIDSGLVFE